MQAWIVFWKYFCLVGMSVFAILFVFLVPFGIKDLMSLFKDLSGGHRS